jgi:hypothetical protein
LSTNAEVVAMPPISSTETPAGARNFAMNGQSEMRPNRCGNSESELAKAISPVQTSLRSKKFCAETA